MKSSLLYSDREDLKALCNEDNPHPHMKTLPTALDCPLIKADVKACIEKLEVPIFFTNCRECPGKGTCPVYQGLRDNSDIEALGVTKANLTTSLLAEERDRELGRVELEDLSMGSLKMRMIRQMKTIIRDECHGDEIPTRKRLTFMNTTTGDVYNFKEMFAPIFEANGPEKEEVDIVSSPDIDGHETMEEHRRRKGPYGLLCDHIEALDDLVAYSPTLETAQRIIARAEDQGSRRELHRDTVVNPYYVNLDDKVHIGVFAGTIGELHRLIEAIVSGQIGMKLDDVKLLLDIFYIVCADHPQLLVYRDGGQQYVDFVAIDYPGERLYKNFIREMCSRYRKAFFLSATIGDFKYEGLFENGKIKRIPFGKNGDPCRACDKQKVIASPYKMGSKQRNSLRDRLPEVVDLVRAAGIQHGWWNVVVVAMSAREATIIKNALNRAQVLFALVDYYRSPYSMSTTYEIKGIWGQKRRPNVAVLVNAAETPRHSMDFFAKDWKDSARKRYTEMCQATYQTMGRVRNGGFSVVYCAGIDEHTLSNICTWGPGRTVKVEVDEQGHFKYEVKSDRALAKPILATSKDIDDMLEIGRRHTGLGVKILTDSDFSERFSVAPHVCTVPLAHFVKSKPGVVGNPVKFSDLDVNLHSLVYITRERCFRNGIFIFQMMASATGVYLYSAARGPVHSEGGQGFSQSLTEAHGQKWYAPEHLSKDCHLLILDSPEFSDIGRPAGENVENDPLSLEGYDTMESDRPQWETDPAIRRSRVEKMIQEALRSIRVTPNKLGMEYMDGVQLLADCFCQYRKAFAKQKYSMEGKKWGFYTVGQYDRKQIDGERMYARVSCTPLEDGHIRAHLRGYEEGVEWDEERQLYVRVPYKPVTYGTYVINDDDTCNAITFDIDAHRNDTMNDAEYEAALQAAERMLVEVRNFFKVHGIPTMLEKSGSPGSYHVILIHKPVKAAVAHWFGGLVLEYLGYTGHEVFPKQATIQFDIGERGRPGNNYDFGNLVKLPMGINQKNGRRSYLLNEMDPLNPVWVRYDPDRKCWLGEDGSDNVPQIFNVYPIDLSEMEITQEHHYTGPVDGDYVTSASGKWPFYNWAITQQLEGTEGNFCRVAIVYQHLFGGGHTDIDALIGLFRHQADFDPDKTRKNVLYFSGGSHSIPWGWDKMRLRFPNILKCFEDGKTFNHLDYLESQNKKGQEGSSQAMT